MSQFRLAPASSNAETQTSPASVPEEALSASAAEEAPSEAAPVVPESADTGPLKIVLARKAPGEEAPDASAVPEAAAPVDSFIISRFGAAKTAVPAEEAAAPAQADAELPAITGELPVGALEAMALLTKQLSELRMEVAALKNRPADETSVPVVDLAPIEGELAAMRTLLEDTRAKLSVETEPAALAGELAAAEATLGLRNHSLAEAVTMRFAAQDEKIAVLVEKLTAIETSLIALAQRPSGPDLTSALAALREDVAALRAAAAAPAAPDAAPDLAELTPAITQIVRQELERGAPRILEIITANVLEKVRQLVGTEVLAGIASPEAQAALSNLVARELGTYQVVFRQEPPQASDQAIAA